MHISTFLMTMGGSGGRLTQGRGKKEWGTDATGRSARPPPAAHSRHNVTLYHALHLVRGSSQPYVVMSITLVADVKHCRKIRGSPAAP